ncbi:MAG TPA: YgeY family selenium metabolism-linked hydrolase [bacterium]|jgi:putative selenium metabolism hydrolase
MARPVDVPNLIEGTSGDVVEFAARLVRVQSPSGQEAGVARLVEDEMTKLGFTVHVDSWGNVLGSLDAGSGPCVLVDAHMDTVGVTRPEEWSYNPWGERRGERLYGRGAMDMKGPLAAAVYGISLLKEQLQRGKVVVSASVAEELVEGPALIYVAEQVHPDYVVICEATSLKIARGQRGRMEVKVDVFGRPTHSSRPDLGVNAAQAMVDVVRALRDMPCPRHNVLGEGILVLTDVKSEPYPGLSVVPDFCAATFDRRTLPGETEDEVLNQVRAAMDRALSGSGASGRATIAEDDFLTYTGQRVTAPNFAPAWFFDDTAEIVRAAGTGLAQVGIAPELTHYAFCTNGSGSAGRLHTPTIGFGPGNEELAHRVDEYVEVTQLVMAARGYAAIALQLIHEQGGT